MTIRRSARPRSRLGFALALVLAALATATALAMGGQPGPGDAPPVLGAPHQEPLGPPAGAAVDALPTPPATNDRVSVTDGESQANGASGGVTALIAGANGDQAISADGRWVAFVSFASNLAPGGPYPAGSLYLRDRQDGTTRAVPWINGGPIPQGVIAAEPAISADGGVVAFTAIISASASRIFAANEPTPYVLAWDRTTGATEVVSFDDNGRVAAGYQPTISADGRYVAYTRWAPEVPPTPPPTPTPRPNTAPSIFNLSASPVCIDGSTAPATVTVHASDPDGDALSLRIQLHWFDGVGNHFFRFPAAMTWVGGDTWTYQITQSALQSYGWNGQIRYNVTARDALGLDSPTLSDDPFSDTNRVYYAPSGCTIL